VVRAARGCVATFGCYSGRTETTWSLLVVCQRPSSCVPQCGSAAESLDCQPDAVRAITASSALSDRHSRTSGRMRGLSFSACCLPGQDDVSQVAELELKATYSWAVGADVVQHDHHLIERTDLVPCECVVQKASLSGSCSRFICRKSGNSTV